MFRTNVFHVHQPLFPPGKKRKFRGTHLQDDEEYYDIEAEEADAPAVFAWSYGTSSRKFAQEEAEFTADLRNNAALDSPHAEFSEDEAEEMSKAALVG